MDAIVSGQPILKSEMTSPVGLRSSQPDQTEVLSRRAQSNIMRAITWAWISIGSATLVLSQFGELDLGLALSVLLSALCGYALSMLLHKFMLIRARARHEATLAVVLSIATACGAVLWVIDVLIHAWADGHPFTTSWPWSYFLRMRLNLIYFSVLFILQGAGCKMLGSDLTLEARERQLLEARLAALRFQLNPHFIFNTLNAISTLVAEAGAKQAEEMIALLSDFLRATLSGEPSDLVPLAMEIDLVQAYLQIESVRFGDRLVVRYACDPGLADTLVPSFILQPIIENAVKYAVAPSKHPVTISLTATSEGGELILTVADDGRHQARARASSSTGVGLANITARLHALYGAAGSIETRSRDVGFTVVVRLPLSRPGDV